jgi:signal transduction histidine kinase
MAETADKNMHKTAPAAVESSSLTDLLSAIEQDVLLPDVDGGFDNTLNRLVEYLDADNGYLMGTDASGGLECTSSAGTGHTSEGLITASNSLMRKVVETQIGMVVSDAMNSREFAGDPDFQRYNIASALCVPVKTNDSAFGLLYLDSRTTQAWGAMQLSVLGFVARCIALAIDNRRFRKDRQKNEPLIAAGTAMMNISHSVKNILQMVSGAAEVVDFGLKSNEMHRVRRSWEILLPNIERMKKYTLELLDYGSQKKLNLGPCDFNRTIQSVIESLKIHLKQKHARINIRVDRNIPAVQLDCDRIHQMALNIILHAIDVVDPKGGLVSVETKYHPDRQTVSLQVTDNGPTITDEIRKKIFTPFESDRRNFCTGLGMATAKRIIDSHGGTIEIESLPSRGAVFTVCLPAKVLAPAGA